MRRLHKIKYFKILQYYTIHMSAELAENSMDLSGNIFPKCDSRRHHKEDAVVCHRLEFNNCQKNQYEKDYFKKKTDAATSYAIKYLGGKLQ